MNLATMAQDSIERLGVFDSLVAFVVPAPGAELSESDVIAHLKTRTSGYRVPSRVHFVDDLPKSPVGKVLRRELRERATALQ